MSTSKIKETSKRRSPGSIGITKRADKFEATYSIPRSQLPEGSPRKRITAWGDSERSATSALIEKLQTSATATGTSLLLTQAQEKEMEKRYGKDGTLEKGEYQEPSRSEAGPTLAEWVEEWKVDWMSADLQESTKKTYFHHLNTYILPFLGHYHLNDLSARVLKREWWDVITQLRQVDKNGLLTDEPVLGPSARANIYKTLRQVLITAYHKLGTRVALSPRLIPIPKASRPEGEAEIREATVVLRKLIMDKPNKEDPLWSIFSLCLVGLRQAERLGISVSDIDLRDKEDPVIRIHQQLSFLTSQGGWYVKPKLKNGLPRTVPLWGVFLEAVEKQLALRKEWSQREDWNPDPKFADLLFLQPGGKLWTRRQDNDAWHEFVGEGIRGHLARHVTATILADRGIGVETAKILLGHSSDSYAYYYRLDNTRVANQELSTPERIRKPRKDRRLYMVE